MLAAWEGNDGGSDGGKAGAMKRPAAAQKRPAAAIKVMKCQKDKKSNAKSQAEKMKGKAVDVSNMKLRLQLRPRGCGKCRNRPGCCLRCFKK